MALRITLLGVIFVIGLYDFTHVFTMSVLKKLMQSVLKLTRKEYWSWEISNNFCTYWSIPDADKNDGTGPL
ncbi:hypothetical protein H5410_048761 [Solanum commersonii]|uniref:Uncharacterized protein n=1 Tax=Solanum commersonii TaxID=4109 RepID=A0A9J5XLF2_SOLCO|nr:hypothetical protein H5410_048761 [Solanum commersonii]